MLPDTLSGWTLDHIRGLTSRGVFESDTFDLKLSLPYGKDETGKRRLQKTVAAFANSGGGYLVFGVRDEKGLSIADRIVGIDKLEDLPAQFGNYPASCYPPVEWNFLNPPISLPNDKAIHVIEVLSTWNRPHAVLYNGGGFIFPKRTNKGNEDMTFSEVRSAFREAEFRRSKLSLLISELEYIKKTAGHLLREVPEVVPDLDGTIHWAWATRYSTTLLDMTLGDAYSFFSGDPELWTTLCSIRDSAKHSNVTSEALSNIVYLSMSRKAEMNRKHYALVRQCAQEITRMSDQAIERLKCLIK